MLDIPSLDEDMIHQDSFVDEHIFLISSMDPWYGDIIIYLQTLKDPPHLLRDEHWSLHNNSNNYLIIGDTLYLHGVDSFLGHFLTHDEVEFVFNDRHSAACGSHLFGLVQPKNF